MNRDREPASASQTVREQDSGRETGGLSPKETRLLAKDRLSQTGRQLEAGLARTPERDRILRRPDLLDADSHFSDFSQEAEVRAIREYSQAFDRLAAVFIRLPSAEKQVLVPRGTTLTGPSDDRTQLRLYLHWDSLAKGLTAHRLRQALAQELEETGDDSIWQPMDGLEPSSSRLSAKQAEYLDHAQTAVEDFIEREVVGQNPLGWSICQIRDEAAIRQQAESVAAVFNQVFDRALENGDRVTMKTLAGFLSTPCSSRPSLAELFRQYGAELNFC